MKRYLNIGLLIFAVLAALVVTARLTNALQYYSTPTTANEPTIKNGDRFFASRLVKPTHFDFICYKADLPMMGEQTVTHRLCGLAGDTVEIRDGIFYLNGKNADADLPLMHNYRLSTADYAALQAKVSLEEYWVNPISTDSVEVPLSDAFINANRVKANRKVLRTELDKDISALFSGPYNQDQLGPFIVPKGNYFVLGDNRHNAQDSRYLGFIDEGKFVATVLWK